eukprot:TRINITY_DN36973_c0_g2_i1.p1 TRINITY_DN36973_c0_g2~~TRINITY_DN36973_c0_g2_i1.p1  ORF type:complete len:621 (+),score=142.87 TRINITY_DN36973_c0_g2_i1:91-1953(+)
MRWDDAAGCCGGASSCPSCGQPVRHPEQEAARCGGALNSKALSALEEAEENARQRLMWCDWATLSEAIARALHAKAAALDVCACGDASVKNASPRGKAEEARGEGQPSNALSCERTELAHDWLECLRRLRTVQADDCASREELGRLQLHEQEKYARFFAEEGGVFPRLSPNFYNVTRHLWNVPRHESHLRAKTAELESAWRRKMYAAARAVPAPRVRVEDKSRTKRTKNSRGEPAAAKGRKEKEGQALQFFVRTLSKAEDRARQQVEEEHHHAISGLRKEATGQRRVASAAAAAAVRRAREAVVLEVAMRESKQRHAAQEAQRRAEEQAQAAVRKEAAHRTEMQRRRENAQRAVASRQERARAKVSAAEDSERDQLMLSAPTVPKNFEPNGLVAPPCFWNTTPRRPATFGAAHQLLPPQRPPAARKTIIFDLDETLVRYVDDDDTDCSELQRGLWFRRGAVRLLQSLRQEGAEVVLWTAGSVAYAEALTTLIDPSGAVEHVIGRHSAWFKNADTYTKDLRCLGRPLSKCLLVENNPQSGARTPGSTLLVPDYMGGSDDDHVLKELSDLLVGWMRSDQPSDRWLASNAGSALVETHIAGIKRVPHLRPSTASSRRRRAAGA